MNQIVARTAMVDNQIRPADVTRYDILMAFLETQREHFLPARLAGLAYSEAELELAPGRAVMRPRSLAKLISEANPKAGDDALVVGVNHGYEVAILSRLVASVIAVESDQKFVNVAEENLRAQSVDNAVVVKAALERGVAKSGPFDLIVVNGAIRRVPNALFEQLRDNGRLAAIVEENGVFTGKIYIRNGDDIDDYSRFNSAAPLLPGFQAREKFAF